MWTEETLHIEMGNSSVLFFKRCSRHIQQYIIQSFRARGANSNDHTAIASVRVHLFRIDYRPLRAPWRLPVCKGNNLVGIAPLSTTKFGDLKYNSDRYFFFSIIKQIADWLAVRHQELSVHDK